MEHFDNYYDHYGMNDYASFTQAEKDRIPPYTQYYWWVHLSCARWILFCPENNPRSLKQVQSKEKSRNTV